jgi:hypothetical protein
MFQPRSNRHWLPIGRDRYDRVYRCVGCAEQAQLRQATQPSTITWLGKARRGQARLGRAGRGAPVTTGAMALFCPQGRECEFWVPEVETFARLIGSAAPAVNAAQGAKHE